MGLDILVLAKWTYSFSPDLLRIREGLRNDLLAQECRNAGPYWVLLLPQGPVCVAQKVALQHFS